MDVAGWLIRSIADARDRGLAALVPLLETLARSTAALRAADADFGHPAATEYTATDATEATEHTEHTERTGNDGRG